MKEMTILLLTLLILSLALISISFFSSTGLAATAYNTTTIVVNISASNQITVSPTYLEWTQIAAGNNGTDQTITITNTGSTNFATGLYASVDSFAKEASNPLQGTVSSYSSGSFLVLKNSSDTSYYFVNRMEWNDSSLVPVSGANANGVSWGKYRNKTQWWLWEVRKDNNGECRNTTTGAPNTAAVVIQNTQANLDLSTGTTSAVPVGNNSEYGIWTFAAGPLIDYCVAVRLNCQALMIYRWDHNTTGTTNFASCTTTQTLNASLAVGKTVSITANVFVPSGTPSGNTTSSTLRITAET